MLMIEEQQRQKNLYSRQFRIFDRHRDLGGRTHGIFVKYTEPEKFDSYKDRAIANRVARMACNAATLQSWYQALTPR